MMLHLGIEHCLKTSLHHRSKQGVEFTDRGRTSSELGGQLFAQLAVECTRQLGRCGQQRLGHRPTRESPQHGAQFVLVVKSQAVIDGPQLPGS